MKVNAPVTFLLHKKKIPGLILLLIVGENLILAIVVGKLVKCGGERQLSRRGARKELSWRASLFQ